MAKSDTSSTPSTSTGTAGTDVQALRDQRAQETDPAKVADLDRQISEAESPQGGAAQ